MRVVKMSALLLATTCACEPVDPETSTSNRTGKSQETSSQEPSEDSDGATVDAGGADANGGNGSDGSEGTDSSGVDVADGTDTTTSDDSSDADGTTTDGGDDLADTTPPPPPADVIDGEVSSSITSSPMISWSASSELFVTYEVALGTGPGLTDVATWTNIGLGLSHSLSDLVLAVGATTYASVRAVDFAGNKSAAVNGDGWVILAYPAALALSSGTTHTCAILDDSSVKCWGANGYGQLGYNDIDTRGDASGSMASLDSVYLGFNKTATAIATGDYHTCVIVNSGSVKCWGRNNYGQLGLGNMNTYGHTTNSMNNLSFVYLGLLRTAKAIALGSGHSCALLDNGTVKCWGRNEQGQLGYDDTSPRGDISGSMLSLGTVNLGTGRTAKAIAAGSWHTCALLDDDSVKCWGMNDNGQLGQNDVTDRGNTAGAMAALTPIDLGTGRHAVKISAGHQSTCVVLDNGQAKCWGANAAANLGYDDTTQRGDATNPMSGVTALNLGTGRLAKQVDAGGTHTCAVLDDDTLKCWGDNSRGQLGYDDQATRGDTSGSMAALVTVSLGATVRALSLGAYHTCAITSDYRLKCWGNNLSGELGYDDTAERGSSAGSMAALSPVAI